MKLLHTADGTLDDNVFQTVMMVDMHMLRTYHDFSVVMLYLRNFLKHRRLVMVIYYRDNTGNDFARLPLFLNESGLNEMLDCLRAGRKTARLGKSIEPFDDVFFNGN